MIAIAQTTEVPVPMDVDPRADPHGGMAQSGLRFAGGLLVLAGAAFSAVIAVVGVLHLTPDRGVWHALSLVFSVGSLTGQATPDAGAGSRVVMMILAVCMASCYMTMAIGAGLLWQGRTSIRHPAPRGRR